MIGDELDGVGFPAVQMRLGFGPPTGATSLALVLHGLTVLADATDGRWDEAWQHLTAVGVKVRAHDGGGLAFGVADLSKLRALPSSVTVTVDGALSVLWELVRHPPAPDTTARLDVVGRDLRLRWLADDGPHDLECPAECHASLLTGEVSFTAGGEAWMMLRSSSALPAIAGRARVGGDRVVEIVTAKPQLVEGAPLPGLFRRGDGTYGTALRYAERVRGTGGIQWDGDLPSLPPMSLSERIAWSGGAILVGDPVAARASVNDIAHRLECEPVLVVTTPWRMWAWQVDDGWVCCYDDVAGRGVPGDPGLVVFDDIVDAAAAGMDVAAALERVGAVRGVTRVAITAQRPGADADGVLVGAAVKPAEFDVGVPVLLRYPGRPAERLAEHLDAYVVDAADLAGQVVGGQMSVRRVPAGQSAALELGRARVAGAEPQVWAAVDAALAGAGGPWFAGALEAVAARSSERVAVCCTDKVLAHSIAAALRPRRVAVLDEEASEPAAAAQVTVLRFASALPDPSHRVWEQFDVIVVCGSVCGLGRMSEHAAAGRDVELVVCEHSPDEARVKAASGIAAARRIRPDDAAGTLTGAAWPDIGGADW